MTFLFTDVEGSTRLLHDLGAEGYARALSDHRQIVREACSAHGGVEVDTQGDAFFFAFPTAPGALDAAAEVVEGLAKGPIRVRVGVHTGTPLVTEEGYVGADVHRAARIAAAGHGGQVLLSAATAALVDRARLRELGKHRLKDLSAPERIYQLGDRAFPALETLYRTNLPVPPSPFLGRERELAEVVVLLSGELRLLTLTGPGGTGKTRLALQAAGAVHDAYPEGVWWVPLGSLSDPALVPEAAARVLGAGGGLAEHIGEKRILLLLDNFEQLLEAAADLGRLLSACPKLRLLVTSRQPLHVTGEQEYPVPPLAPAEAVDFFLTRARAVRPGLAPDESMPEICRRLDELPLALELAAARVSALSPPQILERLERRLPLLTGGARDAPERQRTLRATIEWSHELLTHEERRLFARLAVFRGGCTIEAAEAVAGADLDTLQRLVDQSLLRHQEGRFWMLETIREYAAEQLALSRESDQIRHRHAEHFLAFAEADDLRFGQVTTDRLDRLGREQDNLRAALEHLRASGEADGRQRLAAAASPFWSLRGHLREGGREVEDALAEDPRPTPARAQLLAAAAGMAVGVRDFRRAKSRAREALDLHRELGDAWGTAYSRFLFGYIADEEGEFEEARKPLEESLQLFEELGDERRAGLVRYFLAWAYDELGDVERASSLAEESLRRARARGDDLQAAWALEELALRAARAGRLGEALSMETETLRIYRDFGDRANVADSLSRIAAVLARQGREETAARLLARSVALHGELGVAFYRQERRDEQTSARIRAGLDGAALAEALERGKAMTTDEAVALALGT